MKNNKMPILVIIGIIVAIIGITGIITLNQEPDSIEIENSIDKELVPDYETMPEVQDKIEEIKKTNDENEYSPKPREWITSGPFQIDRSEYILGEKIFMRIGSLGNDEKGQVTFLRPLNNTHSSVYIGVPFDGVKKTAFNYYVEPQLSKVKGICTVNDVIGEWTVVFRGTEYPNIKFKITEDMLPGTEESFQPVC